MCRVSSLEAQVVRGTPEDAGAAVEAQLVGLGMVQGCSPNKEPSAILYSPALIAATEEDTSGAPFPSARKVTADRDRHW